jgi:Arabinose efflux permease
VPSYLSKRLDALRGSGDAGKLSVLMFTAFIDMVGALMIIPLLPFYAKRFGATDFAVMVLVASFSAMQLLSAPLWGRVSDRYGRKPALLFGLGSSMIAYVVFAYADSYWLLLASRIIQGAGGGTTGVIQAYVADSMAPKDRARGLGWLSAATNAGVVIGPAIASFSHNLGPHWPGMIAALLCAMNILFASRYLPESHDAKARLRTRGGRAPFDAVIRVAAWTSDNRTRG